MSSQKKILLVEDESAMLNALSEKFSRSGLNVVTASNGEDGLATALKEKPDLIMVDLIMPKMDGMSMISQVRDDSWGKDVDVIFLTNLNDPEQVAEAAKMGVYDFLVKTDWRLDDVVAFVKNKLDNQPTEEE